MPPHLATGVRVGPERLTTNGLLAYNVITVVKAGGTDALRALGRTLRRCSPQVYVFRATDSLNVVLLASQESRRLTMPESRAASVPTGMDRPGPPGLFRRPGAERMDLPANTVRAPVLTDDHAPIER